MTARHLIIKGRVQGVFFRAWTEKEAMARGLNGWVRNRRDGTVEAVFSGDDDALGEMIDRCHEGPPAAGVEDITVTETSYDGPPVFEIHATA